MQTAPSPHTLGEQAKARQTSQSMFRSMIYLIAPLLSLAILLLGNGLFGTLLVVRLYMDEASPTLIGMISTAYYAGLAIGSFRTERFIIRVGHMRAYAAFASILAVACLLPGLFASPTLWILMRFLGGICMAGLFIVIESWLLAYSSTSTRGKILSLYMFVLYASQAMGQFLLNLSNPETIFLFCLATILCSLSVVPICITYRPSPELGEPSSLSFKALYKISPSGIFGCFASGLILGAIYGLLPLYASEIGLDVPQVALIMGITILGGTLLQFPVGYMSDFSDRRKILLYLSLSTIVISLVIIPGAFISFYAFLALAFLLGGATFSLYPISISHTCDYIESRDIVAVTQGLLLAYGVGATIGPLFSSFFISTFGHNGLLFYLAIIAGVLSFFVMRHSQEHEAPSVKEQQNFVPMPNTTPIATELDPRAKENSNGSSL